MRKALRRLLGTHGFSVEDYECGNDFLAALPTHRIDCVVLDLHMPEVSGFDVLAHLAAKHITTPVIVVTGHDEPGAAERTLALGACAFLIKPVDETALVRAIEAAIAIR